MKIRIRKKDEAWSVYTVDDLVDQVAAEVDRCVDRGDCNPEDTADLTYSLGTALDKHCADILGVVAQEALGRLGYKVDDSAVIPGAVDIALKDRR